MHSPADPHDPDHDLDRQDNLTLLALGEQADAEFLRHHRVCDRCQAELAELSATARLARSAVRDVVEAAPPRDLWDGIAAEVFGTKRAGTAAAKVTRLRPAHRRSTRWRTALVAAAVVAAASVGGFLLGRNSSTTGSDVAATAQLVQQPGGPSAVSGAATVIRSSSGYQLDVKTKSLPYRTGYYAVWVYNPAIKHMINVGVLDATGHGTFAIPQGVDIHSYDVVDVSAQNFDGNPAHEKSVLRGGLTQ